MSKQEEVFDIFISYRREGGYETARLLYDRLVQLRYRVSFDLETLRGGRFNTQLYSRIDRCTDVIAVMSKTSLELRENPDDDWFRLEIAHALKAQKNIVPVFLRDFAFPAKGQLPEDIAGLVDFNGVTASQEHFDSTLKHICKNLKSNPRKRIFPFVGVVLAILIASAGLCVWQLRNRIFEYPCTEAQVRQLDAFIGNAGILCTSYNNFILEKQKLLDEAGISIASGDAAVFYGAQTLFERNVSNAKRQFARAAESINAQIAAGCEMPLDYAGIPMFLEATMLDMKDQSTFLANMGFICNDTSLCEKSDRLRFMQLERDELDVRRQSFECSIMAIFCKIRQSSLGELRKILRGLAALKGLSEPWLTDEAALEQRGMLLATKLEECVIARAAILGNTSQMLVADKRKFIQMLVDNGATQEFAEEQYGKIAKISQMKARINSVQTQLDDAKDAARIKFAPKDDDDVGILWGKVLRFRSMGISDAAELCMDILRRRNCSEFPPEAVESAKAFYDSGILAGIKGGLLICSFEPPATSHDIFKVGDIIAEVNGKPCVSFSDYSGKEGNSFAIYRRDTSGNFQKANVIMPASQPNVGIAPITETE